MGGLHALTPCFWPMGLFIIQWELLLCIRGSSQTCIDCFNCPQRLSTLKIDIKAACMALKRVEDWRRMRRSRPSMKNIFIYLIQSIPSCKHTHWISWDQEMEDGIITFSVWPYKESHQSICFLWLGTCSKTPVTWKWRQKWNRHKGVIR